MENEATLKEEFIDLFGNNPISWLKWLLVFIVLGLSFYIIVYKIFGKIEYKTDKYRKIEKARAKGNVLKGTLIKTRYSRRNNSINRSFRGTYEYEINGQKYKYSTFFDIIIIDYRGRLIMEYIIEVKNLEKKYGNFKALNNLNIHIEKGSIYGLVGKNGAGKTTLIRLLCGLEEPTSGIYSIYRISNKDKNINKERQKIGAIIEYPYLYYNMNAYDNIKEVYKIKGITSYEEIDSLLDKVGLLKEKNKKVRTFSLGMKQRLMIACALVGNPDLLILDEPINGLDPEGIIEIRKLVLDLNKKSNITILISSHYLDELSKIATNYGFIDKGHIVEEISYEELNSKIREKTTVKIKDTDKLAEYLDDNNINYEKTGKEEITIYNKINIPKFITELNNNKIEIEDIKEEKDTLENYFLKLLGGENE